MYDTMQCGICSAIRSVGRNSGLNCDDLTEARQENRTEALGAEDFRNSAPL
jgi:hypothetical protein